MASSERLTAFLREAGVRYTVAKHPVVYTAQEIAAAQHVPGRQLAKCVLVLTDQGPVLSVLPAMYLIDPKKLKSLLRTKKLSIARESDIKERFPDIEVGAMSPFGNLYGVPVVVDEHLPNVEEIVCNAGSHTETIKIRYGDFARLARPKVGAFAQAIARPTKPKRTAAKRSSKPTKASAPTTSTHPRTGSRRKIRRRPSR